MDLGTFRNDGFDRGASRAKEIAWMIISALFVSGWMPGSGWRANILRAFGAKIGRGVVLKPRVRVKFPWRLEVGSNSWIGEGVWIDNLAMVRIGHDVCISQGAYLCTGNHDWTSPRFDLVVGAITIEPNCWVGAKATVAPGTLLEEGAVLGLGAVGRGVLHSWTIYGSGLTAKVGQRQEKQMKFTK